MKKLSVVTLASILVVNWAAGADGTLGTDSTDSFQISVNLTVAPDPLIKISGLQNFNFDKTIGDPTVNDQIVDACVYMDQSGTYTVEIDANPLIDGSDHYPYELIISQGSDTSKELLLQVNDVTESEDKSGYLPSSSQTCFSQNKLTITAKDIGSASITEAFSASATVSITVKPD